MHTLTPIRSKLMLTLAALVLMAAAVAVPLAFSGGHSHAAPAQRNASNRGKPNGSPFRATRPTRSVRAHVHPDHAATAATAVSGDPFLYVDDGSFFDLIDVFQVNPTTGGLTFVGAFPTTGGFSSGFYGTQDIDVTPANTFHTTPCLVYIDNFNGFVDSFPINATTGSLGARVSHLFNFNPIDVHISAPTQSGQLVYVNSVTLANASQLASYSLGAGCVLTAKMTLFTPHFHISFALLSPTSLVTVDSFGATIDTYTLASNGNISPLNSVLGQIAFPDSVAVRSPNDVFTGQATFNSPQAQGGQEDLGTGAITPLVGSPKRDPDPFNSDGAAVFFDNLHSLLVQGEQFSASLVIYSFTPGSPVGSMAFKQNNIFLDFFFAEPTSFAQVGNTLFVNGGVGGDLEACPISASGISGLGCQTVAVLSNPTGFAGGSVVL